MVAKFHFPRIYIKDSISPSTHPKGSVSFCKQGAYNSISYPDIPDPIDWITGYEKTNAIQRISLVLSLLNLIKESKVAVRMPNGIFIFGGRSNHCT